MIVGAIPINVVNIMPRRNRPVVMFPNIAVKVVPSPLRLAVVTPHSARILGPVKHNERQRLLPGTQRQASPLKSRVDSLAGYAESLSDCFATISLLIQGVHGFRCRDVRFATHTLIIPERVASVN